MKRTSKLLGIAVLIAVVLVFAGCDNGSTSSSSSSKGNAPSTNGKLTITGIPSEYNGKYAYAFGWDDDTGDIAVWGAKGADTSTFVIYGEKVSSGKVTTKVWEIDEDTDEMSSFNRSGDYGFLVFFFNEETIIPDSTIPAGMGFVFVSFTNGVGSGAFISDIL